MIKENYQRVKDLLITNPKTRDNDNLLLSIIWQDDILNKKLHNTDFWHLLENGELTNFESVRRVRQKIQSECKELRGKRYDERNWLLEPQVKEEIKLISVEEQFGHKKYEKEIGSMF